VNFLNEDIIVAIATPPGTSALAIIRLSGKNCIEIVDKIFLGKKSLTKVLSHTIHYGKILDKNKTVIDDVLISVFKAPHSYTGEESVEISHHGNPLISSHIISSLLNYEVRIAEPGEFTKRAFLNGKIDLAQAEAVIDVINSRTVSSLKGSRNQLDGLISEYVSSLRNSLVDFSSLLEVELDFAEEDVEFVSKTELINNLEKIISRITELLKTYSFGKIISEGANVAIVGEPNVGKSSLLNKLLKESRAIVSDIPGTTRDIIHEDIEIRGLLFKLYDTAGLRNTPDKIEREGVSRSIEIIRAADIVLFISDVNTSFPDSIYQQLTENCEAERIVKVLNKIDLDKERTLSSDVKISCKTGEGIDILLDRLINKTLHGEIYTEKTAILTNVRHFTALRKTKELLEKAIDSIKQNYSGEFISVDLRSAENQLNEIIGVITSEDILNNIFSKFCIGK
jgi:tRNA modification GTPase